MTTNREKELLDSIKELIPDEDKAYNLYKSIIDVIEEKISKESDDLRDMIKGRGIYDPDY